MNPFYFILRSILMSMFLLPYLIFSHPYEIKLNHRKGSSFSRFLHSLKRLKILYNDC